MPMQKRTNSRLFVVAVEGGTDFDLPAEAGQSKRLSPGLLLVDSELSQPKLYHAIKRQARPDALFVGSLSQAPKFKGMAPGSLRWLRNTDRT